MDIKQFVNPIKNNLEASNGKELTIINEKKSNNNIDDNSCDIYVCACLAYLCICLFNESK